MRRSNRRCEQRASYVAFVASKSKAAKVLQHLGERGIGAERLNQVRAPAGTSIPNGSPEEIAVSILAEMQPHPVDSRRQDSHLPLFAV